MAAGRYADAIESFRKAKMRAGFYKDTNQRIKAAEAALSRSQTQPAAASAVQRKGCLGVMLFFI